MNIEDCYTAYARCHYYLSVKEANRPSISIGKERNECRVGFIITNAAVANTTKAAQQQPQPQQQ